MLSLTRCIQAGFLVIMLIVLLSSDWATAWIP